MKANSLFVAILAVAFIVLLLLLGIVGVILLARKQRLSQQLKEANLQSRINDVNFAALRSQMNPHFIFNCLNSIKLYTEQNNNEAASEYLSMFAQLIRSSLDNARREKVILSEEIATIELYLRLEAMRFKEKLLYEVAVDKNVDVDFIELPPMMIQPYIENAIWHGLMHKKEGGNINVHFAQLDNNSLLQITITDNGIGRLKAAELKSKTAEKHKSYGTQITGERIALINEKYQLSAEVKTTDLYNDLSQPSGTLITIKLPIK
ncbi:histidine kinase [Ferruginibacter paludis]|uniref:sensor histidine kinase n=1 Tax=Ferruginibacter paludis TaxID=1310417 RepID=UPI0025B5AE76|nr:histidine kinase [Ferruginibacter paludis]MDN3657837.1 histidine kinase [Ferruginibacter paludis]